MCADRKIRQGPNKDTVVKCNLPQQAQTPILEAAACLRKDAAESVALLKPLLQRQPIYQHFLKNVSGFKEGWLIGSYLVAFIDIRHGGKDGAVTRGGAQRELRDPVATKLSHIIRYCGYAGGRDKDGLPTGRLERRTPGVKLGYNADLRTALFNWAAVLVKGKGLESIQKSKYFRMYADTKFRLTNDPRYDEKANTWAGRMCSRDADTEAGGAKAYIHSKSWHKAVHLLIEDLYIVWRALEGLPVWPSFYAAKMGYGHGGMPTASKYGPGLGPKLLSLAEALEMVK